MGSDQVRHAEPIASLMEMDPAAVMAQYQAGAVSRRQLVKLFGAIGLAAAGSRMLAPGASAEGDLNIIIWEGYADDKYRVPFEDANDATVNPTPAGTGDEMFALMQGSEGRNYDAISASSDLPQRLHDADLLAEIDPAKLTNFDKLYDQFKKPPYITFDDKLYGVNFAWGPTILLYNPNEVPTAPTSWNALFDEEYEGRIATWNYPLQIAQYALLLEPKPEDPYELSDEQLAQVHDMLIKQKPLIRKYWDFGEELNQLFATKEIVLADGWSWITQGINSTEGLDFKAVEVVPEEGVTGWSDSWVVSKNSPNIDLAIKWADWMIGTEAQLGITEVMNYSITNKEAAAQLPPERQTELRLTDVAAEYAKIHMWRFIPGYDKWVQVWNEATQG